MDSFREFIERVLSGDTMITPLRAGLVAGLVALTTLLFVLPFSKQVASPLLVVTPTPVPAPAPGRFTATGSMSVDRIKHTATLLPDGKVLVAGGRNNGGELASSEIYDPATEKWTSIGNMWTARSEHTATSLKNGMVLVTGGTGSSGFLDSSELYDPDTGTWSVTGSMATARREHTATLLQGGKVLIVAGFQQLPALLFKSTEIYDSNTGTFSSSTDLSTARFAHTATLLQNGKLLVAGGDTETTELRSAELFDPVTGVWTDTGQMTSPREGHTATLLPDGNVLLAGGRYSENVHKVITQIYDTQTGVFSSTQNLSDNHYKHTATSLLNGDILIAGALLGSTTAEKYRIATSNVSAGWYATGNMLKKRSGGHTATLLQNGKVLIAGGRDIKFAELYDPDSIAAFVSTSEKIAFSSRRDGIDQIYIMDTDGSNQTPLPTGGAAMAPEWSPDATKILFVSRFPNDQDNSISVMRRDGTDLVTLLKDARDAGGGPYTNIGSPHWSPDGSRIVFEVSNLGIFVMTADGSNIVQITDVLSTGTALYDRSHDWSPNGERILFERTIDNLRDFWTVNFDGSDVQQITHLAMSDANLHPAYSPDGAKIAYSDLGDIYMMNADGSNLVNIGGAGNETEVKWSPDGTQLVINLELNCPGPGCIPEIWTMNTDGSNRVNLTNNSDIDLSPDWGIALGATPLAPAAATPTPTPIPSLSTWGLVALGVFFGALVMVHVRRRATNV